MEITEDQHDDTRDGGGTSTLVGEARETRSLSVAFQTWHRLLRLLLILHVPLLAAFAYFREVPTAEWVPAVVLPAALVLVTSLMGSERYRAALTALGFTWCSWLLVVWSGGAIEAHFHGLVVIGLIGLYRDPLALGVAVIALALLPLGLGPIAPEKVYSHAAGRSAPLVWGFIHLVAIIGAAAVPLFSWRGTREAEDDSAERATEALKERAEMQRQQEVSAVYATVARRSQTLLERQLDLIDKLESDESDPDTLQDLFSLDHLATRMNREAASMLVLAGGEPNRRVVGRPPMSEVVRAAVGEIEDYTRVDLRLADDRTVEGRAVPPLVHLLSELVENAATFSPPDSRVTVDGATSADGGYVVQVIDRGIGLDPPKMAQYNHLLANPRSASPGDSQRLGLEVVSRLAGRLGMPVQLAPNAEGPGSTATVVVPVGLLDAPDATALSQARPATNLQAPSTEDLLEVDDATAGASGEGDRPVPEGDRAEEAPLPTMEPAPPVPVGIPAGERQAAASRVAEADPAGTTAPIPTAPARPTPPPWAQTTAQGPAGAAAGPAAAARAAAASPTATPAAASAAPGPASAPATPTSTTGAASWSYGGHLSGTGGDQGGRRRRGIFGRRGKDAPPPVPAAHDPSTAPTPEPADATLDVGRDDLDALLNASRRQGTTPPSPGTPGPRSDEDTGTPPGPAGPTPAADGPPGAADTTPSAAPHAGTPSDGTAEQAAAAGAPPVLSPEAQAARRLLEDLPGAASAGGSHARPVPQVPVNMPLRRPGQGPAIPAARRDDTTADRGTGRPSGPPRRPDPDEGRPTIGAPSSQRPSRAGRPTIGAAEAVGRDGTADPAGATPDVPPSAGDPASTADQGAVAAPLPTRQRPTSGPDAEPTPLMRRGERRPATTGPSDAVTAPPAAPSGDPSSADPSSAGPAATDASTTEAMPDGGSRATAGEDAPAGDDPTPTGGVTDLPRRRSAAAPGEPEEPRPRPENAPTSDIGTPLPKRRRGENLPAGLRTPAPSDPISPAAAAAPVSREQSRSLLSSYQSRLQAGRRAAEDQTGADTDDTTDVDAPDSSTGET